MFFPVRSVFVISTNDRVFVSYFEPKENKQQSDFINATKKKEKSLSSKYSSLRILVTQDIWAAKIE